MSACRSAVHQPLAPLVDLLRGFSNRAIQSIMVDVMPIIIAPQLRKEELINQLADYVRSSGLLVDVCNSAVKGLRKDYLHMILRQYDPKADQKRPRSAMIDHFTRLNMPKADENLRDDGPCLAIVPYLADCGARTADFHAQVVDYDSCGRTMRKTKREMNKKWMKGARLLRRKLLSKAIVAELKRCLRGNGFLMQWTVASLRDHVSSVVDKPLHSGHARLQHSRIKATQDGDARPSSKKRLENLESAVHLMCCGLTRLAEDIQHVRSSCRSRSRSRLAQGV